MYDTDGDFGQVRLVYSIFPQEMEKAAVCFSNAGWHKCNSRYHIDHPEGMNVFLLLFTVGGEGCLCLNGHTRSLPPGTVALVPPFEDVSYYTPEHGLWEFYWLHPVGEAAEQLLRYTISVLPDRAYPVITMDVRPYAEGIEQLLHLQEETQVNPAVASALTASLLYRLLEELSGTSGWSRVSGTVIRYMEGHYTQSLPLRELAAQVYLSPSQLIRRFKRETGYTPHEYLNRLRIARAERLLRYTDMPVGIVAQEVGFRQSSRFIQLYKEINGITPGDERHKSALPKSLRKMSTSKTE